MTGRTRNDVLADLSDAVRELVEPRTSTEYREVSVREEQPATNGRRRKAKRTRRRTPHIVTLPSLLDALRSAAIPGAGEAGGAAAGGFESRPSAELEPLSVLTEIISDVGYWARTFNINRPTLAGNLNALVSAHHDDDQLARITTQAKRWVKRARMATGFDPAPFTIGTACPYCARRHSLVISGDMLTAKCARCQVEWSPDTIGLLADMLRANQDQETMVLVRCHWSHCHVRGPHDTHQDSGGRTWRDTCDVEWIAG